MLIKEGGELSSNRLAEPLTYGTAASEVTADSTIALYSKTSGGIDAVILENTPAVISSGKRRMQHGFGFYWKPYQPPIVVHPDSRTIITRVAQDFVLTL